MVEADEYDTAFFDKRSKFVHYRPLVAILNNLEYDHADIFPDVAAIQRQFHHLVRTVPRRGRLIVKGDDERLRRGAGDGRWTPVERFGLHDEMLDRLLRVERAQAARRRQRLRRGRTTAKNSAIVAMAVAGRPQCTQRAWRQLQRAQRWVSMWRR